MKVLITGAGGFIGSHLVDSQLEQGFEVRAVDLDINRLEHVKDHPRLQAVQGDITQADLVDQLVTGVGVVYHLASAHLDVRQSETHYRQVNVEATQCLLEASQQAGVMRFVHCSSVGVIGNVKNPPADEASECHPNNIYGKTKLEGERAALEFQRKTRFPVVVVRPAWVYGPRCPRTEKLLRNIQKGRFPIFGGGKNLRHPVYIQDAVAGLELAARAEQAAGEVLILAGSSPVLVKEMLQVISEALGVRPPKLSFPLWLGMLVGFSLEQGFKLLGKQTPFSRRSLEFFTENNGYSIEKARRILGYQPKVDLHEGFRRTIQWNREQRNGLH
jgi:nucleoside-diphosphate-sugar epimerase